MEGILRMWIKAEGDGTGELFAEFDAGGFSGRSSAWFQLSHLADQAKKFAQYPLLSGNKPCISGGFWNNDATKIEQEHLHISAYPTNTRGDIALFVMLAVPRDDPNRPGLLCSASVEINASYEQMAKFSRDLESLICGDATEILFSARGQD